MIDFDFTEPREDAAAYLLFDRCTIVTITSGTDAGGAPIDLCYYSLTADAWNQWYAKYGGARRTV